MKKQDFERLVCGEKTPIFKHKDHGILIADQGEYAAEKELCETCQADLNESGAYDYDCGCQEDTHFIGFWPPVDWKADQPAPYFVKDSDTPTEMLNDDTWIGINVMDLEFTEKYYKETIDLTCVEDQT